MYPFQQILLATDLGETSKHALDLAVDLAKDYGAALTIVHAVEVAIPPYPIVLMPDPDTLAAGAQQELDACVERVQEELLRTRGVLLRGHAADKIVEYIELHPVDLVVVGTHGRKGATRWLLGSVAEKIVRSVRPPVLTVHETEERVAERVPPLRTDLPHGVGVGH